MFSIAFYIGIFSYLMFSLGLLNILHVPIVLSVSLLYVSAIIYVEQNNIYSSSIQCITFIKSLPKGLRLLFFLVLLQAGTNLLGTLGPELSFDGLWYHLTLPKIYLLHHKIFHIPGSLLYYSDMPKLAEMMYVLNLSMGSEIFAKLSHFSFGVLTLISLYKISRKFFSKKLSFLAVIIFYSNLVVGWMSVTAYIDLTRTFFELLSFWAFLNWLEKKESKWLIESGCLLGLAISTKLLAIGSIIIFLMLIALVSKEKIRDSLMLIVTSLLIPLPWFIFSYVYNNNPVYPFFTKTYPVGLAIELINPVRFLQDVWIVLAKSADPINPLYLLFLPLGVFLYKQFTKEIKIIAQYCFLAMIVWYVTPRTGGGRFLLPYLPVFSLLSIAVLAQTKKNLKKVFVGLIIFFSLFSVVYRFGANSKYIPVLLGLQTKSDFLSKHLNFSYGDFYDIDEYFKMTIKPTDRVLLYEFHNLYYVDFPFIDSTWVKRGDRFNYIATQNSGIPGRFEYWNLIYSNPKTLVKLYSLGGQEWMY
ncbi:MAG: hypothetical protein A3F31_01940 [Candidatus Levybacteria bacterium RIFCSPHIGHO2_12_FULL_38_12]|nr:MAG: hypothetical protein A2770_00825 [Candidatus Levybacteria bacterium RIFCSPHIGHO2_01_FULL_38_12]OGH22438.1 MAG: hypothetical protein A3D75_00145 [Candidatus Levybacteria bacterium RIFCSPHIGHO2_02_FULL_37_18]OGH23403.1 MAG: hypothetical protein A3F31_01940 [Candidatus Levybacteria bacterium RIFCSPHIGHO2_12_FULL_38_12]OGH34912.1 MAG: hypothetical protein A3A47_00520 [Candidatus Levybacteria bacterium RIFCSPLOWO2_01_FULL_37_20]OGH43654.1 MAG: hypothetical protein A3J14_02915 [Candidatus Lev